MHVLLAVLGNVPISGQLFRVPKVGIVNVEKPFQVRSRLLTWPEGIDIRVFIRHIKFPFCQLQDVAVLGIPSFDFFHIFKLTGGSSRIQRVRGFGTCYLILGYNYT
uniref:Uncharacterized protein n=1 Tax=Cacopsylla melanoneura TaxID=428564 RepID=A0A8D8YW54_9HEMI